MPDSPQEPVREKLRFQPIKTTKIDTKGRFYLPNSLVENLFAGVPEDEREVVVYLGPNRRILLVPADE